MRVIIDCKPSIATVILSMSCDSKHPLKRDTEESAKVDKANELDVGNKTNNNVEEGEKETNKAEEDTCKDLEDSGDGNINIDNDGKDEVEVNIDTDADADLEASSEDDDDGDADVKEESDLETNNDSNTTADSNLEIGEANTEDDLDLGNDAEDDRNVELDGDIGGDINEVGLDTVQTIVTGVQDVGDRLGTGQELGLTLHNSDILSDDWDGANCNSLTASSKSIVRSCSGKSKCGESSSAEKEESLERRHVCEELRLVRSSETTGCRWRLLVEVEQLL
jgi:hypothetical protein